MAEEDAKKIIADANAEAERLISESEITRQANERAENLRRSTIIRSNKVYNNARQLADDVLEELMNSLVKYYNLADDERSNIGIREEKRDEEQSSEPVESEQPEEEYVQEEQEQDEFDDSDDRNNHKGRFSKFSEFFRGMRQQDDEEEDY